MKNIVLCFDRARDHPDRRTATNAEALLRLLDDSDDQLTWYHPGTPAPVESKVARLRWRQTAAGEARAAIAEAYEFLVDNRDPGDRIYLFGVGRGAYCAHALTRLLGTVGLLPDLMDYVLAAYAVPRTRRSPQDWRRLTTLAAQLTGRREIGVPVDFLGLWDMVSVPGHPSRVPVTNVLASRHAVAIDGTPGGHHLVSSPDCVEEVWFRGAHCDVAGGPGACWPLADIALDWVLDGAVRAGISVRDDSYQEAPAPTEFDALAASARTVPLRKLPGDPLVHASVDVYLQTHPEYWRRLPAHVVWADTDWLARSERLVHTGPTVVPQVVVAAAS
ncbi:phospholipase effector Tle1 domain-containing protein [Mycobacterium sp. NPDC048908]|uniref:phospholipase effector Tle1 domain-containing protein n=1 Tax=Mycobacterium sp. NPDC048908 TaxID=3364292 RepID=UPI00371F9DE8